MLKVGDRVAVYYIEPMGIFPDTNEDTIIDRVLPCKHVGLIHKVNEDLITVKIHHPIVTEYYYYAVFHIKQCRRLVKKKKDRFMEIMKATTDVSDYYCQQISSFLEKKEKK